MLPRSLLVALLQIIPYTLYKVVVKSIIYMEMQYFKELFGMYGLKHIFF